ncbi:hypothetical protein CFC21_104080 [Triticum aestivum]|uniref:Uncharacterized protein n=2 Tax=Triticum aestivum TaxID=4565 RepID=A0A9R1N741_WHEAT|nr:protein GLUTAMINE DUMPER 6-like isoform X1 [Triticum aestivum]KAF7103047.1 hypothetical protein CFC21_104080 [Triticum aestivum]
MRPIRAGEALVGVAGAPAAVGHGAHLAFWRTPTPYLLLGFALMMGIIAVALLVLVCTDSKPSGSSRRGSAGEDASARGMAPLDREPKVVVIMAGDDMPSFLASARPFAFPAVDADADEPRNADAW